MKSLQVSTHQKILSELANSSALQADTMIVDLYVSSNKDFVNAAIAVEKYASAFGGLCAIGEECIVFTAVNKNIVKIWKISLRLRTLLSEVTSKARTT